MEARSFTNLGFEEKLFKAADKLRKNMDAAEYKHIVLGLIFLKFVSDAFHHRRNNLVRELRAPYSGFADNADAIERTLEDRDEYAGENIFWVPMASRWSTLQANATQPTIGKLIDDALYQLEQENPSLKGVFTKNYSRSALESRTLTELINLFSDIDFMEGRQDTNESEQDVVGRVYEYCLKSFATAEGKRGGQFYTPPVVVRVLVEMLEPYEGRVFDPCCGSGGMFVQSRNFIREHTRQQPGLFNKRGISVYGQESNETTWRLCKMNLAVHGIDGDIAWNPEGSFMRDAHPDLRADFVIANPPFNDSDWGGQLLRDDARWKYGAPPVKENAGDQHFEVFMQRIYLDFAELQALNRRPMTMAGRIGKLDDFLRLSEPEVLAHAGSVSRGQAEQTADLEFGKWRELEANRESQVERKFRSAVEATSQLEKNQKDKKP